MDIAIIGAGLGGLSASCLLASKGHNVTIFEKNKNAGGKINEIQSHGFRFDTGPSLLTMPFILESLFQDCGVQLSDYLEITPLNPICRYFYKNGGRFDCYDEIAINSDQIENFAPDDVESYRSFLQYSLDLYRRSKDTFLFNPLYSLRDLTSLNLLDFFRIDAFSTMADRIDTIFESTEMRQFFKRFATYNGSSPYQAPATLNVIPHVELALGGYYIDGGMYALVHALQKLGKRLGVTTTYQNEIQQISIDDGRVRGIIDDQGHLFEADVVISNADAAETYLELLPEDSQTIMKRGQMKILEPSSSGFVILLGIDKKFDELIHHNIFFSDNYQEEFRQIFEDKVMPDNPTIYVADSSYTNPGHAPEGGSNLFILINAPYISKNYSWQDQEQNYRCFVIMELERRGLNGLSNHIVWSKTINPADFQHRYRSNRGSIYGTSSNSRLSAFLRPRNKSRTIKGLYLVGGSTHPGGGIPLVILSAFHATELIKRYEV